MPGVRQIARESGRIFPGTKAEAEILDQVRRQEEVLAKVSLTKGQVFYIGLGEWARLQFRKLLGRNRQTCAIP